MRLLGADRLGAVIEAATGPGGAALRRTLLELVGATSTSEASGTGGLERSRIDQELRVARRIQRSLVVIADLTLDGWQVASDYRPAREIGGDFFDVFPILGDGPPRLGIVIADVSGKGISAALLMAFVRPVMRAALDRSAAPADALERTNAILSRERRTGLFVTVLAGVLDLGTGILTFANAGHEPPLMAPADGSPPRWVGDAGPLVGAFGQLGVSDQTLELERGDLLLLYTDGITDAANAIGERFGEERLARALADMRRASPADTCLGITSEVLAYQGDAPQADDLALLVVRRLEPPRETGGEATRAVRPCSRRPAT